MLVMGGGMEGSKRGGEEIGGEGRGG